MKPAVFLTGATGFLGMEVLARAARGGRPRGARAGARRRRRGAPSARLDDVLAKLWDDPSPYRDRVRAVAGDAHAAGARPRRRRAARASPSASTRCCTARPRSRSTCRSTRRARSTSRARARCSTSRARRKARGALERFVHVSTAYVGGRHEGTFRERQLDAGQAFRNTYEQTKCGGRADRRATADDLAPGDRAAEHRHGRVRLGLDAGVQRPLLAAAGVLARAVRRASRRCPTAASTSCRSTTSPTRSCTCSTAARPACSTSSPGATPRRSTSSSTLGVASASAARRRRSSSPVRRRTPTTDGAVYVPYFDMQVVFDDARARSVLVPAGIEAPPLRDYFAKLIDYARGRALGQAEDDARGRARAARGARGHVSSKTHEPGYSAKRNRGE